jgi:ABC-type multidrug transport system permease subunit
MLDGTHNLYSSKLKTFSMASLKLCVQRQARLYARDKRLIIPRVMQNVILGLILGSFYRELQQSRAAEPDTGATLKIFGLLFFIPVNMAFFNMIEIPLAVAAKRVLEKQLDAKLFTAPAHMASVALTHLPIALLDCVIYGIIAYWLAGLASDAGVFFVYLGLIYCWSVAMSAYFRLVAFVTPSQEVANVLAPLTMIFMLVRDKMIHIACT